jgi:serine/threonine-protein kinase
LGHSFQLERELRGGMSRVFVAREHALGRTVVLKVLPPDLAAGLSAERFRREIQVAASLQHPHIVPLLNAGQAGDFLYYTMPFVEGESLRARLARQGELPVRTATRILSEVTRALAYAHRHGIVHRDIKPDNILLCEDEAQVADFGISKAISASVEQGGLTSAGVALGTPMYMAPEQAAADPAADARADLYALGVVAYEMLDGQPPFQGRSSAQLFAAHATEQPVPLRTRRPAVPAPLSDLVMALLEKRPGDRPQTAEEVLQVIEGTQTPTEPLPTTRVSPALRPAASAPSGGRRGRWLVAGGVAALALVLLVASLARREPPVKVDRSVVAVAPFRVSGADSSLNYLREGMVDLLAAKLGGTSGIRAADPRGFLSAWRRAAGRDGDLAQKAAIQVASRVGAGRLIQGDLVGTRQQLTLNAALLDAASGKTTARATVEGSTDSLPRLVDQLAGKLLALEAGEGEQRLASLISTSFSALKYYLEGQALIRRGDFPQASGKFEAAIREDSTFALAGLGLTQANIWRGQPQEGPGSVLAWKYRSKLAPQDRALLEVFLGDRWPVPRRFRSGIAAAERFVQMAPDNVEAWFHLGDNLYHFGALVGIPDALQRASAAFKRAQALDSSFTPVWEHASSLALELGDTVDARRGLGRLLRVDSTSILATCSRWELALATEDSASLRVILQSDSLHAGIMLTTALARGLPLRDMPRALQVSQARAVTADQRAIVQLNHRLYAIIAGRPSETVPWPEFWPEPRRLALDYLFGRFAEADSISGEAAGRTLDGTIGTPLPPDGDATFARYAAGQHAFDHGRLDRAQRAAADLRSLRVPKDSSWLLEVPAGFALILEAELASARHSPELPRLLNQLDSALVDVSSSPGFAAVGNLILARLYEAQGNLPRALATIRRRILELFPAPFYLTYHREEARLAALNGDRAGAIRAYRRYLALRSDAEPQLQPVVAQVRGEFDALQRETTDR